MRCPQSRPATISCRQTMTASKTFGGAGERRRFESRLSLTYTTNGRPKNMRMGLRWTEVNALCFCTILEPARQSQGPEDLGRRSRTCRARTEDRRHLATQQAARGSCLGVGVLRAKLTSILSWLRSTRSASITHDERDYRWPPGEGVLPRYAATGPVSAMPRHSHGNISRAEIISRL